ncbi:MAG: primosomal protein N' [Kiritimatiellae bacterium]|nr:primosomal protein N' [Kiritimatiellia bacterium]
MIARVAIDTALDRLFDYEIPAEWAARAVPGARVRVPFGRRTAVGYVVEVGEEGSGFRAQGSGGDEPKLETGNSKLERESGNSQRVTPNVQLSTSALSVERSALSVRVLRPGQEDSQGGSAQETLALGTGTDASERLPLPSRQLKPLLSVEGERPYILSSLLRLACWMAAYYLAPVETCLRAVLPAPVRAGRSRDKTRLFVEAVAGSGSRVQGSGKQCKDTGPTTQDATLSSRQRELLENIRRVGGGWLQALCKEFACSPDTLRKLADSGHLRIAPHVVRRDPLANRRILPTQPLALNPAQAEALAAVVAACGAAASGMSRESNESNPSTSSNQPTPALPSPAPRPILLFGVTGSGKTEVYLQAIARVLEQGRGAIVLVPEIALTPQTVQRFAGRFGARIAVLHSALSDGERYDEWQRIRKGEARVVIGPRSAVFAPVERLGLIVVDEEHEPSYKQEETPRYHARDVAVMRAHLEQSCAVVLGSATPSLESWRNATRGKYALARLPQRADNAVMPLVHVVDMRRELARSGHVQVFSQSLIESIRSRLERGEQTMLFLNRRGYATSLVCPACGFVATCAACNVAFTYHRVDDCLRCHICGAWQRPAADCPACHDPNFRFAGFGTQRIEQIVARCFPRARVARMDADATSRKFSHDDILGAFRAGRTDILIGTQMIAKGLHFPNVTLVGIVLADSSLHLPDFRAGERTFQLLAQVSGRTGRGATPGEVIVQTYTPEHPAVTAARTEDFETFAQGELASRSELGYPPFVHLACLTLRSSDEQRAAFTAGTLARALRTAVEASGKQVLVSEACPAPLAKARGEYRYQIMLRAAATAAMQAPLREVLRANKTPDDVALAVDMDAVSVL